MLGLRVRSVDELVERLVGRAQCVRLQVLGFFEQLGERSGICRHVVASSEWIAHLFGGNGATDDRKTRKERIP